MGTKRYFQERLYYNFVCYVSYLFEYRIWICILKISTQGISYVKPVSYTHLDVYKRQIYAQGLAYYVPDNLARYGAAIDHVSFSSSPDVYKRQILSQISNRR